MGGRRAVPRRRWRPCGQWVAAGSGQRAAGSERVDVAASAPITLVASGGNLAPNLPRLASSDNERRGEQMAHIFIVDDDPGIRTALRSALEAQGHTVSEAGDGLTALERLRTSPWPLVVLLDLTMPYLDGAGVLGTLAGDRALAQRHRYVLMTASAQTLPLALGTLLVRLGVPLVRKPFDLEMLLDIVADLAQEVPSARRARNGVGTGAVS